MWNYLPEATGAAAIIKQVTGVDAILVEGSKGIFDILADGNRVYSKYQTKQFPTDDDVKNLFKR